MKTRLVNTNFKSDYIRNLLTERGVADVDKFYEPTPDCLQAPCDLENIGEAAMLLEEALKSGRKILIVVD